MDCGNSRHEGILEPSVELGAGEVALRLASEFGWRVFPVYGPDPDHPSLCECHDRPGPCTRPAKHPRVKGAHNAASADPDVIRQWWSGRRRLSNIGVALRAARLVVIDLDVSVTHQLREDGSVHVSTVRGQDQLQAWLTANSLELPKPRYTVRTPKGGWQLYFRAPDKARGLGDLGRAVSVLPCVDVLADGYVITAPGWRALPPGPDLRMYDGLHCPCQVPAFTGDWARTVVELGREIKKRRDSAETSLPADGGGGRIDVESMAKNGVPRGEQDSQLWRAACSLAFRGCPEADIAAKLWEICEASARAGQVDPRWPWTWRDASYKAQRAVAKYRAMPLPESHVRWLNAVAGPRGARRAGPV